LASAAQPRARFSPPDAPSREPQWTAARHAVRTLWLIFSAELIVFALIRLPLVLSFDSYAFADRGMFPTVCYLVTHGRRPAIDFGYPYGLLPILMTQGVFHLFRWAPISHECAMGICAIVAAWGMARFARAMRLPPVGVIFLVVAFPFAIVPSYPSFVHAMEAAVLCNALAEQAAGHRSAALALATVACLIKPAMGYVYGFVLLVLILCNMWRAATRSNVEWRFLCRALAPAVLLGASLVALLMACYGLLPLAKTLFPATGTVEYHHMGLGSIFRGGRDLWYQPKQFPAFYLFTVAGFWTAATVWLVIAGVWAAWRMTRAFWRRIKPTTGEEMVFTCAVLHLAFITSFFGSPVSWEYYSYILVMGVAAAGLYSTATANLLAGLTLLTLSGQSSHLAMAAKAWKTTSRSPEAAGLWAPAEEQKAWQRVLGAIHSQRAVALISTGEISVLFAQFQPPFGAYLAPGVTLKPELDHAMRVVADAPMVFAVTSGPLGYALDFFPRLRQGLQRRPALLNIPRGENGTFTVYGPGETGRPTAPTRAP